MARGKKQQAPALTIESSVGIAEDTDRPTGGDAAYKDERKSKSEVLAIQRAAFEKAERQADGDEREFYVDKKKQAEKKAAKVEHPVDDDDAEETDEPEADDDADEPIEDAKPKGTIEHRQCLAALQRSKQWSADELAAMTDDEIIRRGRPADAHFREYDRTISKSKGRAGSSESSSDVKADPTMFLDTPVVEAKPESDLEPLFKALEAKLGEEVGPDLRKLIDAVDKRGQQRAEAVSNEIAKRDKLHGQRMLQTTREQLVGQFDELADDATFQRVQRRMKAIMNDEDYEHLRSKPEEFMETVMFDACRAARLNEAGKASKADTEGDSEDAETLRRARRNGKTSTSTRRVVATDKKTRMWNAFKVAERGGGPDAVKKAAGL